MLFDYVRVEIKKILYSDNEGLAGAAQFVKFLVGFFFFMIISILCIIASIPLAMFYFVMYCCFFISSIGKVRGNPFAFHFLED